jgi:hypothetical protein
LLLLLAKVGDGLVSHVVDADALIIHEWLSHGVIRRG